MALARETGSSKKCWELKEKGNVSFFAGRNSENVSEKNGSLRGAPKTLGSEAGWFGEKHGIGICHVSLRRPASIPRREDTGRK